MGKLIKVVSGGQTGVDQAALRAAMASGLDCGGWCPPGRTCESGSVPDVFPLRETPSERSPDAPTVPRSQRTEWNVRDSDATLILRPRDHVSPDPGTDWAGRCAARHDKLLLVCDPADPGSLDRATNWLTARPIRVLNVAGPSEGTVPGIHDQAYAFLLRLLRRVRTS